MRECFTIYADEIEDRLDAYFYKPYFKECVKELSETKFKIVKLNEICKKITDGTHFTPKYMPDGIPFLSVKDISENEISFEDTKFISLEEHQKLTKRCKPEQENILLTKVGTVGLAAVIPKNAPEFSIFVSVALLKLDKNKAKPYYASAYLNSKFTKFQIERIVRGIGVPDLHLENIAEIKIILPPLEIQNKVAQMITKAYNKKKQKESKAQQLLCSKNDYVLDELGVKLPELKDKMTYVINSGKVKNNRYDAYYYQPKFDMIGKAIRKGNYKIKELKEIIDKLVSGKRPKGGVKRITEGVPSIGGEHITSNGGFSLGELRYISREFHERQKKSRLVPFDILIVKDGATTGKVAIVPQEFPYKECNINEHVFKMKMKKGINPYFFFHFLLSDAGQSQIKRQITGATQKGVTRDFINNVKIPFPPLEIQNEIAREAQHRRQRVEQLKREAESIMRKAKEKIEKMILGG